MAHTVVAQSDRFSVFNNIAGIAASQEISLFSSYHSHFAFQGLGTSTFGAILPFNTSLSGGLSLMHFGDKFLNQTTAGAGIAHRIDRFKLGLKLNYQQLSATSTTLSFSRKTVVLEFGGIWSMTRTLDFGAHLYNATQSKWRSGSNRENVPTLMKAGITYRPVHTLQLATEVFSESDHPTSFRCGLQYEPIERVFVRTGIATSSRTHHFGIGFVGGSFVVDYAYDNHSRLGSSHHLSIAYILTKAGKGTSENKFP